MTQDYRDRNGLAYADIWRSLPARVADWPKPPRYTGSEAMSIFHAEFAGTKCWYCEDQTGTELHHLAAGSRGRAHERPLFAWSCSACHRNNVGESELPVWLLAKWEFDRSGTDWLFLTIRLGHFPPDLTQARARA